ncbi:hypothetical protein [Rhodocaloribacter sp.]
MPQPFDADRLRDLLRRERGLRAVQPPRPPLSEASAPRERAPSRTPVAHGPLPEATTFSPDRLRDRVVRRLLDEGRVTPARVELAWHRWQRARRDGSKAPLWRELACDPNVDRAEILEAAARSYAFDEVEISFANTRLLIDRLRPVFTEAQWDEMIESRVLPIAVQGRPFGDLERLSFVSPDPTNPDVRALLRRVSFGVYTLCYARQEVVEALIVEVFPYKKYLITRDLFAGSGRGGA